ncbi:MAG: hypothetical protein HYX43_17055 [Burkholderiales bacterium]|nr:hypothetical protein [Burkholderiales bacterium]
MKENESESDFNAVCDCCGFVFPGEEAEDGCPSCGADVEDLTFEEA